MDEKYDVVVVGGGAAGLSGALALSRARRSILVVDDGTPRNARAGHVHNYLGREGATPAELLASGRAEVAGYGGQFVDGRVARAERVDDGFRVVLSGGDSVLARRLLVTTGLVDELPDIPGVAELFGSDVLHCPYCHGWEVRDQSVGVLGGPFGVHQALMWRQWSADVTLFQHTGPVLTDDEREQLAARDIAVRTGVVEGLELNGGRLSGLRLRDGSVVPRTTLVVSPRFIARAGVLTSLGLETVPQEMNGHVVGSYVAADPTGATAVAGVWVAGNVADLRAQVISSAAAGLSTAAALNADLIAEDVRLAVEARRLAAAQQFDEESWEERYRAQPAVWSGRPNAQLVAEASALTPGSALDVGCGEGGDALWLAARGWQVTAVDFATAALERGAARAAALGPDVAARIRWVHADVTGWAPETSLDLVSAQFMQLPGQPRRELFARLAAAVAPGGTLLVVGHDPSDMDTSAHRSHVPDMFFSAEEVADALDGDEWDVLVAEARPRAAAEHEGAGITVRDAVLRARRR
jgi:thioredoxin reductase/SAM-dependent methyltransferase